MKIQELFELNQDYSFWINTKTKQLIDNEGVPHVQAIADNPDRYNVTDIELGIPDENEDWDARYHWITHNDGIDNPVQLHMYKKGWVRAYVIDGEMGMSSTEDNIKDMWDTSMLKQLIDKYDINQLHIDVILSRTTGRTFRLPKQRTEMIQWFMSLGTKVA